MIGHACVGEATVRLTLLHLLHAGPMLGASAVYRCDEWWASVEDSQLEGAFRDWLRIESSADG